MVRDKEQSYYQKNRDVILIKAKDYYSKNKEKISKAVKIKHNNLPEEQKNMQEIDITSLMK